MELDEIRKEITTIDGHVQQVGSAIDKVKSAMLKIVDAVEELSRGYTTEIITDDETPNSS